jgi:hypothetical protein
MIQQQKSALIKKVNLLDKLEKNCKLKTPILMLLRVVFFTIEAIPYIVTFYTGDTSGAGKKF